MRRPLVKVAILALLLSSVAFAQRDPDKVDLKLKILYSNSRPVQNRTQVQLCSGSGSQIDNRFTDDQGNVIFPALPIGNYRIRVLDPLVEENLSEVITLSRRDFSLFQLLTVPLKKSAQEELQKQESADAMVSALDLNVPSEAKKEFQKGAEAMKANDTAGAISHLLRAIDIYPQYAMAWNHLGVVYMQTNQPDKGKEAFAKAVELNPHYPSALINLATVRWSEKKPAEVEQLMRNAVAADPSSMEALAILCNALVVDGKVDEAVADANKLHSMPQHQQFALVHFLAARALLHANRGSEAAGQLQLFLQEAPTSPAAPQARQALAQLNVPQQQK
jgi:tetratricopeptide (TPR) repeat protein